MPQDVLMPPLGDEAGDECRVSFWYKDVGEQVEKDDPLVQMTTDKAVFDVPSPLGGRIAEILAKEDEMVKVGSKIAAIEARE